MVSGQARRKDGRVTPSYLFQNPNVNVYTICKYKSILPILQRKGAMLVSEIIHGRKYLTIEEACSTLRISRETFRQKVGKQLTPYEKGNRRQALYAEEDILRFLVMRPRSRKKEA